MRAQVANDVKFSARFARVADGPAVDALRLKAYSTASNFSLKDAEHIAVKNDPVGSRVLGLWAPDGDLAACVRLTFVADNEQAFDALDVYPPRGLHCLPAVTLCRGSTDPRFRGQGLMPMLCALAVRTANLLGAASVVGVQIDGTPHQRAMVTLGWEVHKLPHVDVPFVAPEAALGFVMLPQSSFDRCLAIAAGRYAAWPSEAQSA